MADKLRDVPGLLNHPDWEPFNILTDPWVHVLDGETWKTVGLRELIEHAHEYRDMKFEGITYYDGAAAHIFIETFLYRAYMTKWKNLDRAKEAGCFDIGVFDDYVKKCKKDGVSFDIFDLRRPFMQTTLDQLLEEFTTDNIASVGTILPATYPSGQNVTFFYRTERDGATAEDTFALTPEQYFLALIRERLACPSGGCGYSPSPLAQCGPPLICLAKGKNVFETLYMNLPVPDDRDVDECVPMWERYKELAVPKEGYSKNPVPWMFLPMLSFRCAFRDEDGNVTRLFKRGIRYNDLYKTGKDERKFASVLTEGPKETFPYTFIRTYDNGDISMMSIRNTNPSYLDIVSSLEGIEKGWFTLRNRTATRLGEYCGDASDERHLIFDLYGLNYKQTSYVSQYKGQIKLPAKAITDIPIAEGISAYIGSIRGLIGRYALLIDSIYANAKKDWVSSFKRAKTEEFTENIRTLFFEDIEQPVTMDIEQDIPDEMVPDWETKESRANAESKKKKKASKKKGKAEEEKPLNFGISNRAVYVWFMEARDRMYKEAVLCAREIPEYRGDKIGWYEAQDKYFSIAGPKNPDRKETGDV